MYRWIKKLLLPCLLFAIFLLSKTYPAERKITPLLEKNFQAKVSSPKQDTVFKQEFINKFMSKYPNNTGADVSLFLQYKEEMYRERRLRIQAYCQEERQRESNFSTTFQRISLLYDDNNLVSYCMIPKVGSTTWCKHFVNFANLSQEEKKHYISNPRLAHATDELFPFVNPETVVEDWKKTTSIVIVRHPMSRLASLYYNKILRSGSEWKNLNREVIKMFRENQNLTSEIPTPEETIRYILWELKEKPKVNMHWRQEHKNCPFCLLNFTVYARQEDMDEDTAYFGLKTGLADKMDIQTRANSVSSDEKEKEFWRAINMSVTADLAEPWAYRHDLLMFGYSIQDYLTDLQINFDANIIQL